MYYIQSRYVFNTTEKLLKESAGLRFLNPLVFNDVVKKLTAWSIFHDKVQLFLGLNNLV